MISIANDFSRFPAGRYRHYARYSGEEFRDSLLIPALKSGDSVTVNLDGTRGFGSSFLEEAFGGLVRSGLFNRDDLHKLHFVSDDDPSIIIEIREYIESAFNMLPHEGVKH